MRNQVFTKDSMSAFSRSVGVREFERFLRASCASFPAEFRYCGTLHFDDEFYEDSIADQRNGFERPWVVHLVNWMNRLVCEIYLRYASQGNQPKPRLIIKLNGLLQRELGEECEVIHVSIERNRHTVVLASAPTYHIRATEFDIKVSSPDQQQPYEYWRPYVIKNRTQWCCESSWIKQPHIVTAGKVPPALIEHYIRQLAKLFQNTYAAVDPVKRSTIPMSELKGWRMRRGDISFSQQWLIVNDQDPQISIELGKIWTDAHDAIRALTQLNPGTCSREEVDKIYNQTLRRLESEIFKTEVTQ